jgi:lipopolysaccharide/colanic/teichoic acid biosynthesis glycosyltransferase
MEALTSVYRGSASHGVGSVRRRNTQSVRVTMYLAQACIDLLVLAASFGIADYIRHGEIGRSVDVASLTFLLPIFAVVSFYNRVYTYESMMSAGTSIGRVLVALGVALAIDLLVVFAVKDTHQLSRSVFFAGSALAAMTLVMGRLPLLWYVRRVLRGTFMRRVLIIDDCPIDAPPDFETLYAGEVGIVPDVHNPIMLHNFSTRIAGADRVVVSCSPEKRENWSVYLKGVGCWGELLVPELHGIAPIHHEPHLGLVGIRVSAGPLDIRNRILKRLLDLLFTVPAIVLLTPVFVLCAVAIKLDSRGPVLFRQRRMGRGNRLFDVYKFRSMKTDLSDKDGNRSASRDDDRITRVGRLIRATSIDELPQLFNVLEGDMSLVGPRPHALGSLAGTQLFWQVDQRYWLRHAIKPGITGLAQVRGYRGATDHQDDLSNRLRSDLEYVADWTIVKDLAILARTALVLVHKNAY